MDSFERLSHTGIYFGKGKIKELPSVLADEDDILIVYGKQTIKNNGIYDFIVCNLISMKKRYYELSGVVSNPRVSLVYKGIKLCKAKKIKLILAVGGGSVIDTAKAIAIGACCENDIWQMFGENSTNIETALPIGVVLTNFGSGSEVSNSSVLSNDKEELKRYIISDHIIPKFAILDSNMLKTMTKKQVGCALVDAFSHSFERYFVIEDEESFLDGVLVALMKGVVTLAKEYLNNSDKSKILDQMMWISTVSHIGITETGRCGDWGTHDLAHELGQKYNLPHGEAVAIAMLAWIKYNVNERRNKRVVGLTKLFAITAEAFCLEFSNLCKEFGVRVSLSKDEMNEKIAEELARKVVQNRSVAGGKFLPLTKEVAQKIFSIMGEY